jgi:hypothetical protein
MMKQPAQQVEGSVTRNSNGNIELHAPNGRLQARIMRARNELVIRERGIDVVYRLQIDEKTTLDNQLEVW